MKSPLKFLSILLILPLCCAGWALAQGGGEITRRLQTCYDLMGEGKLDQAKQILDELSKKDPGNPLALNGLAAIMVVRGNYPQALDYLEKALARAKGQRVRMDRPCDIGGLCLPLPAAEGSAFTDDLEETLKLNIMAVQIAAWEKREGHKTGKAKAAGGY